MRALCVALAVAIAATTGMEGAAPAQARSSLEPLRAIVAPAGNDARVIALGRRLFHDPILSRDRDVSCASCHPLATGGSDNLPRSIGTAGAKGDVNAPTVFNSFLNVAQFWDGRAPDLPTQVDGPLTNPVEMAADWPMVLTRLNASDYRQEFLSIFGEGPTPALVRQVIAAFERSLATTGSRFDRWLGGDDGALTEDETRGYALFKSYGCASCHQGAAVGGNMFQKFGFFGNPFEERGQTLAADLGRFNVTGRESDRYVFKVPSLRLAVWTPPYFHDGSVADLREAIAMMGRYQLGRDIPPAEIDLIVAFLATLADPQRLEGR